MADLGEITIGSEQGGKRPVVVIQNDMGNIHSTTTIVMPLSTKVKSLNMPTHAIIKGGNESGLRSDSILLGEQMRVISNQRIISKLGSIVDEREREAIKRVYRANFGE